MLRQPLSTEAPGLSSGTVTSELFLEMDFVTAEYLVCIHSQTTEMKV